MPYPSPSLYPSPGLYPSPTGSGAPVTPPTLTIPYAPTVADIATILRARTYEQGSTFVGEFTADTNPTAAQVQATIDLFAPLVLGRLGRLDDLGCSNAAMLRSSATTLAAMRVAIEIEESYWPEEIGEAATGDTRRAMLDADILALGESLTMCRASDDGGGDGGESTSRSDPAWRFPPIVPLNF